jgi:hypothetical protein
MARRAVLIGPPSTHKLLGALPVVAGFCRRLDIAGIIDPAGRSGSWPRSAMVRSSRR